MACSKAASVKAMMTFKEANTAYQGQDYKRPPGARRNGPVQPRHAAGLLLPGQQLRQPYKPGVTDPANQELLNKAVQNYQLAAEKLTSNTPVMRS